VEFGNFTPPPSPSLDQQRDALRKGLGRALQWAGSGCLADDTLLAACLQDQLFDHMMEGARGDWLWGIIRTAGATDRFRVPILHALYDLEDECSADQLCGLARRYAEQEDETIRSRLYEIVEQKPFAESPWLGEEQLFSLDGESGFLFAARVRGERLANQEWEWYDRTFIDGAREQFGEERVNDLLKASSDEAVVRFWQSWQRERQKQTDENLPQQRHPWNGMPVNQVLEAAERERKWPWLRGWGMEAEPADLRLVLGRVWNAQDPQVITNLLWALSGRALPEFDGRLIELCRHSDDKVRRRAFAALEMNTHPLVRQFALTELQTGVEDGRVVGLFINNYQAGDEKRILEAMNPPDDQEQLHWLLMDVIKVLEKYPEADFSQLGVISYALNPCAACRSDAARLLLKRQAAPDWLIEECRFDSHEDCRGLVEKPAGSTAAN
jgi:hypothetical protein